MDILSVGATALLPQRPLPMAVASLAVSAQPPQTGVSAPAAQVAPSGRGETLEARNRRRDDATAVPALGETAPRPEPGERYQFRLSHEPELDRQLLHIVDQETDQTVMTIPPKQLARMFAEVRAMLNGAVPGAPSDRRVDTAA